MSDNKHKPVMNMVVGAEGAGKTMIINKMYEYGWLRDVDFVDLYKMAEDAFDGWGTAANLRSARRACDERVSEDLHEGRSMLLECTLSTDDMVALINKAKKAGFYVRVFYIGTSSPCINAARVASRVMAKGHSASVADIVMQYRESIARCCKVARMVNSLYVFDNSVDGSVPNLLFHITDGNLGSMSISNLPAWAYPIISPSAF
jgi:predicted ABC-type ATPase